MLSRQEDALEKLETLRNDLKVLEQQQGSTFHQHGQAQANEINQGRFAAIGSPTVIGAKPAVASAYPACSPALAVQLPDELPLAFDNPALEDPSANALPPPVEETGDPANAPSSDGGPASPPGGSMSERAGSSPFNKRSE